MTRYPLQPLLDAAGMTLNDLRQVCPMGGTTYRRARTEGLSEEQADRYACRVGLHPWLVWPEMKQDALVAAQEAEERAREVRRAAWRRHEAKRMQDPAYREAKAEYLRQYREQSRKAAAATSRRYYQANRERLLEKQRERDARRRSSDRSKTAA